MSSAIPAEDPPPYTRENVTGSSSSNAAASSSSSPSYLHPNRARNGIPPVTRRSMEDENRDLPAGWVRQYDAENAHQYFVDTTKNPPRSIWHHPYDDDDYMASLPSEERERIQSLHRVPTDADMMAESSDEEDGTHATSSHKPGASSHYPTNLPPRKNEEHIGSVHRLGRKMKDKLTSSTHEQREADRVKRAEAERKAYETHQAFRRALSRAIETGQPQLLGKDKQGKDVYVQPPAQQNYAYDNGRMYDPYSRGTYGYPNSMYMRPAMPYRRPYGYGYGGGLGLPLMGGLGGGLLLGGLMGGF